MIPTYNQISILFSTTALYSQFISALDKELHSRSSNKDSPIYQTHMQGKKCVITCNKSDSLVLLTGPAMCIWRETTFLRLSFGLFKTFVTENEENQPFQCQNSTPVEPRHVSHRTLPWSPIDLAKSLSDFEQGSNYQPTRVDINRRLNILWDITKSLQMQLNEINKVMNQLVEKSKNVQPTERNQNHITENNRPKTVTINTTHDTVTVSPGTQTYRDILVTSEPALQPQSENLHSHKNVPSSRETNSADSKSRKSNPRKKNKNGKNNKPGTSQEQSPTQTLIIGDSILSGINPKGLKNNVSCQSYSGATLCTLMDKVQIYNLKNFKAIVIYIAGNDTSQRHRAEAMLGENVETEYIEEIYDKLILQIKEKNPAINIYLCSICPRGDTEVDNVNDVIKELSEIHNCVFVDINRTFYNKYNQLKSHFYKPRDNIHLSPSGIRGLLGCINQHIDVVESFKLCAFAKPSTQPRGLQIPPSQGHKEAQPRERDSTFSSKNRRQNDNQDYNNVERCFKCGLTNHKTFECHHKKQLQCYICRFYGHKDSVCWNYMY